MERIRTLQPACGSDLRSSNGAGRAGGNANSNVNIKNKQIAGGVTWVISANKLLDMRFAWTQNLGAKTPYGQGNPSLLTQNGITNGIPTDPSLVRDLNAQSVSGFTQFGAQPSSPAVPEPDHLQPEGELHLRQGQALHQARL